MAWDLQKGKCQICSRSVRLNKLGNVQHHHVRADKCLGVDALPIERGMDHLEATISRLEQRHSGVVQELVELYDRRANFIDPALTRELSDVSSLLRRLKLRRTRLLSWPARFEREMRDRGYGMPPPTYLAEKMAQ